MRVDNRIVIGEDAAVVYPSVLEAEKVYVSDVCAYHYIQHPNSITKSREVKREQKYMTCCLNVWRKRLKKKTYGKSWNHSYGNIGNTCYLCIKYLYLIKRC